MGQKDLAAKQFECSSEVFADIINALIFEGEQVVFPGDLQSAPTESLYPAITLVRQRFKSDMRVVVDYLAEGEQYIPTDQEIVDLEATMRMLNALTGETNFIDNMELLRERQEKGGKITMGYAMSMFVERGREEGIQQGIEEERIRNATAFVKETMMQKQPKEYILGMLQTCFQLKEEEADNLYREGYEREHETEVHAFT